MGTHGYSLRAVLETGTKETLAVGIAHMKDRQALLKSQQVLQTLIDRYQSRLTQLGRVCRQIEADTDFREFSAFNYEQLLGESATFRLEYTKHLSILTQAANTLAEAITETTKRTPRYYRLLDEYITSAVVVGEEFVEAIEGYTKLLKEAHVLHTELRLNNSSF